MPQNNRPWFERTGRVNLVGLVQQPSPDHPRCVTGTKRSHLCGPKVITTPSKPTRSSLVFSIRISQVTFKNSAAKSEKTRVFFLMAGSNYFPIYLNVRSELHLAESF